MTRTFVYLVVTVCCGLGWGAPGTVAAGTAVRTPAPASGTACAVVGVRDAATFTLRCPRGDRELRLAAVVAPRPGPPLRGGEPYGDDSVVAARAWLLGAVVEPAGGTVSLDGEDVREALLARGLVQLARGTAATPPLLAAAERAARHRQLGIWSHAAWRRHQAALRQPLDLPAPVAASPPGLGAVAARHSRRSAAERRQAFAAALAALDDAPPEAPAGTPPPQ